MGEVPASDTLRQIVALDPLPPGRRRRDVSGAFESIVLKCLEKELARRYASCLLDLAEDLDRFVGRQIDPQSAQGAGKSSGENRSSGIRALFAVLAIVATSVMFLLAAA